MFEFDQIISYSRKDAINDGLLHDLSDWAGGNAILGGFRCPVACTASVWEQIQAPARSANQDTRGRAHDVIWMALCAFRMKLPSGPCRIPFLVKLGNRNRAYHLHLGGGDSGEIVATIMQPEED